MEHIKSLEDEVETKERIIRELKKSLKLECVSVQELLEANEEERENSRETETQVSIIIYTLVYYKLVS